MKTKALILFAAVATAALAARFAQAAADDATPGLAEAAIVYATGTSGPNPRAADIYVRGGDGKVRMLTRTPTASESFPAWSPDRKRIAFVRAVRGDADIYVMNANGSGVKRLAGSARGPQDLYPAWSPNGKRIVFASNRRGEPDIYVMRADGSGVRRLTTTARWVDDTQPQFSPDGRHIVFASNRIAFSNYEIYRMRASDGRALKRLTFWGVGGDLTPGDDLMPEYSPDGSRIAFVTDRDGAYTVYTMKPDGTDLRRVTAPSPLNVAFPRWSPDGTTLLFASFVFDEEARDFRLRTVPAGGGASTIIVPGSEGDW